MKISEIIEHLESIAPPMHQEGYDNSGLIVGDAQAAVKGILLCLDSVEAIVDEAITKNCNLIVAHHPIVFKGLRRLTGRSYVERTIIKAIQNGIAIYAIHTNLDNAYHNGVNAKICERLGLARTKVLAPKAVMKKLFVFVPTTDAEQLRMALFRAGAGSIGGTDTLSYASVGMGTANGTGSAMVKMEVLFSEDRQQAIESALREASPDGSLPYDIVKVENPSPDIGAGMVGELENPMDESAFLQHLKERMGASCVRHTRLLGRPVQRVAVCGGAGGFLLPFALREKADVFVTADYKYHEFFDAEGKTIIADIGHFESEQFTIDLLYETITRKFDNFAVLKTEVRTNPVHYF
jgi:dinuclear metal center YbgI/SA1388 family protein